MPEVSNTCLELFWPTLSKLQIFKVWSLICKNIFIYWSGPQLNSHPVRGVSYLLRKGFFQILKSEKCNAFWKNSGVWAERGLFLSSCGGPQPSWSVVPVRPIFYFHMVFLPWVAAAIGKLISLGNRSHMIFTFRSCSKILMCSRWQWHRMHRASGVNYTVCIVHPVWMPLHAFNKIRMSSRIRIYIRK
jgi:hypothetical protein